MVDPLAVDRARREHHGENPSPFTREHLENMTQHKQGEQEHVPPDSSPTTSGKEQLTAQKKGKMPFQAQHKPSLLQSAIEHALHAHATIPHSFEDNFSQDQPEQDEAEYEQSVVETDIGLIDETERLEMLQRVKDHIAHQLQEMETIESGDVHDLVDDMEIEKTNWWEGEGGLMTTSTTTSTTRRESSFTTSRGSGQNVQPPKGSTRLLTETMKAWESATNKPGLREAAKPTPTEQEYNSKDTSINPTPSTAVERFDEELPSVLAPSPIVHPTEIGDDDADDDDGRDGRGNASFRSKFAASPVFMPSRSVENPHVLSTSTSRVAANPVSAMRSAQEGSHGTSTPSQPDSSSSSSSSSSNVDPATATTSTNNGDLRQTSASMTSGSGGGKGDRRSNVRKDASADDDVDGDTEVDEHFGVLHRIEDALENFVAELHTSHAIEPSHFNDDFAQDQMEPAINPAVTPEEYEQQPLNMVNSKTVPSVLRGGVTSNSPPIGKKETPSAFVRASTSEKKVPSSSSSSPPSTESGPMTELADAIESLPGKMKMAQDESWKGERQSESDGDTKRTNQPLSPEFTAPSDSDASKPTKAEKRSFFSSSSSSGKNMSKAKAKGLSKTQDTDTFGGPEDRPPLSTFWERLENIAAQLHGFRALEPHEYSDNFSVDQPLHESLVKALTPEEVDEEERLHIRSPPNRPSQPPPTSGAEVGSRIIVSALNEGLQQVMGDMGKQHDVVHHNRVDPEGIPFVVPISSEELRQQ